jgi:hypothetical protein
MRIFLVPLLISPGLRLTETDCEFDSSLFSKFGFVIIETEVLSFQRNTGTLIGLPWCKFRPAGSQRGGNAKQRPGRGWCVTVGTRAAGPGCGSDEWGARDDAM